MKPSRIIPAALLALGLAASAWAQERPPAPGDPGGVRQDSPPAPQAAGLAQGDAPEAPEIDLPQIEYPEPVTEEQKKAAARHGEGSQELALEQDELSADVQELIEEQTDEKVIQLLEVVEEIMAEVIDSLDQTDTGGGTIAAETEIIEKIFEAAQQRAQQSGGT